MTLYEAHHTLGGRARTAEGPYLTNEGPHALYQRGPHWSWLRQRDLLGPVAAPPLREAPASASTATAPCAGPRPLGLLTLARRAGRTRPRWTSTSRPGPPARWAPEAARAAAHFAAVALFHHDPGALSAAFVQERLRRATALPPEARLSASAAGARSSTGWRARAWNLGVRIETAARIDTSPRTPP